ncbi:MAG TPA: flavodoxin domain-containing protein [Micromonosporaceae bacterium]|jgi:menaquinone-dependent protoporphyrinogen oxidase|nr:flavodoxin domain-containing protein [Micromonosporaceae bacterium]
MKVLVTAASRHGSTAEIAARIGSTLATRAGFDVTVRAASDVEDITGYDAYVLGSAIYMGHWLEAARDLVQRYNEWRDRPVWLFSSGPIGDPPKPDEQPVDIGAVVVATHAREHRLFSGALRRDRLGFPERAMAAALRAPYGDFRDWDAIDAWANEIANTLADAPAGGSTTTTKGMPA